MNLPTLNTVCPKCGATDTQSFDMANRSGTISGKLGGVGISADGEIGIAGGISKQRTEVASFTAPPKLEGGAGESVSLALLVLLIFNVIASIIIVAGYQADADLFLTGIIGCGVGAVAAFFVGFFSIRWVKEQRPKREAAFRAAKRKWEHSWICLRCGKAFFVRPGLARQNAAEV